MTARRAFLFAMIATPMAGMRAAHAQAPAVSAPAVLPSSAPGVSSPTAPIQEFDNSLTAAMQAGKSEPFEQRMATLTPIVQRVFDLPTLLQNSVGPTRWSGLPESQKAELLDAFTKFTVSSYVANFDNYNGEKFVIAPELRHVGRDVVVQTRLVGSAGDLARLDYVMRESGGAWRVVDILLDGSISRVAVTRSDFRSLLGQGDASALIASLRAKTASAAAGTGH